MPILGLLEVIESPLYDTLSIPFGFSSRDRANLFTVPYGAMFNDPILGTLRPKDRTETNMLLSSMLPPRQTFVLRSIRAALFNRKGEMLPVGARHYRGAILEFIVCQKPYWTGPLWRVADPATLFLSSSSLSSFNPDERAALIRSLRLDLEVANQQGVLISEQEPFSVKMIFDPSFEWERVDSPGSLVVLLEGSHARAVQ